MNQGFFEKLDHLDEVIAKGSPVADGNELRILLDEPQAAEYFYSRIDSPEWIPLLRKLGEFAHPPAPVTSADEKTITYPRWPQMKYIRQLAEKSPQDAVELLLPLSDVTNPGIYIDVLEACIAMPARTAALLTQVLLSWLQRRPHILFPKNISTLIVRLLHGGESDSALEITDSFLSLESRLVAAGSSMEYRDLVAVVNRREYAEFIKSVSTTFMKIAGDEFRRTLIDLIKKALRLLSVDGKPHRILRPAAIEQHKQNEYMDDFLDVLVFALRDASDDSVNRSGLAAISDLENQTSPIFHRIAIYLRDKYSLLSDEGAVALLTNPDILTNYESHHEVYNLMRNHFLRLPESAQRAYLAILNTIDASDITDPTEKERIVRHRRYHHLYPIADFLDESHKQLFESLRSEFDPLEHPDFLIYHSGVSMVKPKPPMTASALAEMSDDDLLTFCRNFRGSGDHLHDPIRDLAMELAQLVETQTDRMIGIAPAFTSLAPDFCYFYLSKLTEKLKNGFTIDADGWNKIFELCRWLAIQLAKSGSTGDDDRDPWRSSRQQLATFLDTAFEERVSQLPPTLSQDAILIVKSLTEDPDPSIEREESAQTSYGDIAINSVCGIAMSAAIHYGLWRYRHSQKSGLEWRGLDAEPELKSILQRILNPEVEPRLTVRSVIGQFLPWLHLIDPVWTKGELTNIFPRLDSFLPFRRSAWGAYVVFCQPYKDMVSLLESEYGWAIGQIGTWDADRAATFDVDERLAEHLMVSVWNGVLDNVSPLLTAFFTKASQELRAYAIDFIGRNLKRSKTEPEVLRRLKLFWQWRISEISLHDSGISKEASEFSSWITSGVFDDNWVVEQLRYVLRVRSCPSRESDLLERLKQLLPIDPETVLSYVSTAIYSEDIPWRIHSMRDGLRDIFLVALKSESAQAREQVHEMVNRLGEIGFLEFRDLSRASM